MPHPQARARALIVLVLLLAAALATSSSQAATLGGLTTSVLGGGIGATRAVTGVMIEWNPQVTGAAVQYASAVRLTADGDQGFRAGDTVAATVDAGTAGTCHAAVTVAADAPAVTLTFHGCTLILADLRRIALSVTGDGRDSRIDGDLGTISGTLDAFDGAVTDPNGRISAGVRSSLRDGAERLDRVALDVQERTLSELIGKRLFLVLSDDDASETYTYVGTVGTATENTGIWAEVDPEHNGVNTFPTIVADLVQLSAGALLPPAADTTHYRVVILQTQHLGTSEGTRYGALSVSGVVVGGGGAPAVSTGTQPVGLDARLTYSEPGGPVRLSDPVRLRFCYSFRVTNTSNEPVDWRVTFDSTKAPLWGLNPTIIDNDGTGVLTNIWNMRTRSYDPTTGLWTLEGLDWNRTLPAASSGDPAPSYDVGYCAVANIPPADPATYDAPQISVDDSSTGYSVALRVRVTSASGWLVPWESVIDLADYVCTASLPQTLTVQSASLTHLDGTRYLLRGAADSGTRFVSAEQPRDFVFARYSANGQPFRAGSCS